MIHLCELLKDWPCQVIGNQFNLRVKGITEDSSRVQSGFLFVARKGQTKDGLSYIDEALQGGAVAIVVDRPLHRSLNVPVITVVNCQRFLSYASAQIQGNPSKQLKVIAVTGTNGKTTVSHFLQQMLQKQGLKTALFGTLGVFIDGQKIEIKSPPMTTLPAEFLHPLFTQCLSEGVSHVIMEASSLGLSNERLAHCEIDIGILLNIGKDHFEEHGGEIAYMNAKQKLLKQATTIVIHGDDPNCLQMARKLSKPFISFGELPYNDIQFVHTKESTVLHLTGGKYKINHPFMEKFNCKNMMAALSTLYALSYPLESVIPTAETLTLPPGRMERLKKHGLQVIIDYAHTPDALKEVLRSLSSENRLITVFGCGGNRDRMKRKEMGEVASAFSSIVIVTSDNPRNEDPLKIIDDIVQGIQPTCPYYIEQDRRKAIAMAVSLANEGDVVVIAGKGHEEVQIIGTEVHSFSDKKIASQCLHEKFANI